MKKAVVLLSGGLDSATCLALAREAGFTTHALSFDYGQRHAGELEAARAVAAALGVAEHRVVTLDIGQFGGSAITDSRIAVPDHDKSGSGIPVTYVPARNTVFLAIALGFAESIGAEVLYIGVNSVDYSGYPDCRPAFIEAFERLANLATKSGVEGGAFRIHAPLQHLDKADIIREGARLGVDYALTVSCYRATPDNRACGRCDSCVFRREGFLRAGLPDPTRYQAG